MRTGRGVPRVPGPAERAGRGGERTAGRERRPRRRRRWVRRARAQHDVSSVCGVLEDAVKLLEKDSLAIAQPALFDPLYSVVDAFGRCPNNAREAARKKLA